MKKRVGLTSGGGRAKRFNLVVVTGLLCGGGVWAENYRFEFRPEYTASTLDEYGNYVKSKGGNLEKTAVLSADVWLNRGEWGAAARILEKVVNAKSGDSYFQASAWERLGLCRLFEHRWAEASASFEEAGRLAPPILKSEILFCQAATAFAAGKGTELDGFLKEVGGPLAEEGGRPTKLPQALARWRANDFEGALTALDGAPDSAPVLYMKGLCRLGLKRPVEALADFQRATRAYPGTPWANRARFESGETYYTQGDYTLAGRAFEEGAKEGGGRWGAYSSYRLACIDLKNGEWSKGESRLDRLSKDAGIARSAPVIPLLKIECLRRAGKNQSAIAVAEQWAAAEPETAEAQFARLWTLADAGDWKSALGVADRLTADRKMGPWAGDILLVRGYCLDRLGRSQEAGEAFQKVSRDFRATDAGVRGLESAARLFYRMARYTEIAAWTAEEWASLPEATRVQRPETGYWIAEAALALERWTQAGDFFAVFVRSAGPGHVYSARAYQGWAESLLAISDFAGAESHMQSALDLAKEKGAKPLADSLTLTLAQIYFNGGDYARASDYYKRFRQGAPLDPRGPQAAVEEGVALSRNGDGAGAKALWESVMAASPLSEAAKAARFRLGQSYLRGNEYEKGALAYEGYLGSAGERPFAPIAQFDLGQCRWGAARYGEAAGAFGEFLTRYPNHPLAGRANDLRQAAMLKSGKSPEEVEKETQGSAKSMALADGYWERGAAAFNAGRYADAIVDFDKILSDFATSILVEDAGFYRAESLSRAKRYTEAAAGFKMFRTNFAKSRYRTFAVLHEAECLYEAGDFGAAGEAFTAFAKEFAGQSDASGAAQNAGLCFFKARRYDDAARAYGDYVAGHSGAPDLGEMTLRWGESLEKAGRTREAMAAYRAVGKDAPERVMAVAAMASLARTGRDKKGERRILEELLVLTAQPNDPQRINGLLRLGEILLEEKDWPAARKVYEDVAQNAPDAAVKEAAKTQAESLAKIQ